MQNYAFILKGNVFSENFVLNFIKSNNLKGNGRELAATLNWVAAIFVSFRSFQRTNIRHPRSNLSILFFYQMIH
mgnify:CR=1 FL=1